MGSSGGLWCWGNGGYGQVLRCNIQTLRMDTIKYLHLHARVQHMLVTFDAQLGNGDNPQSVETPVAVSGMASGVLMVAAGHVSG